MAAPISAPFFPLMIPPTPAPAAVEPPMIIAVSAPTVAAVELAERAGITLVALARGDRFEVFSHTDRILTEGAHVG